MIYRDSNNGFIRLQNIDFDYLVIPNFRYDHKFCRRPMHLEFPDNRSIGPTMLVEWTDD